MNTLEKLAELDRAKDTIATRGINLNSGQAIMVSDLTQLLIHTGYRVIAEARPVDPKGGIVDIAILKGHRLLLTVEVKPDKTLSLQVKRQLCKYANYFGVPCLLVVASNDITTAFEAILQLTHSSICSFADYAIVDDIFVSNGDYEVIPSVGRRALIASLGPDGFSEVINHIRFNLGVSCEDIRFQDIDSMLGFSGVSSIIDRYYDDYQKKSAGK